MRQSNVEQASNSPCTQKWPWSHDPLCLNLPSAQIRGISQYPSLFQNRERKTKQFSDQHSLLQPYQSWDGLQTEGTASGRGNCKQNGSEVAWCMSEKQEANAGREQHDVNTQSTSQKRSHLSWGLHEIEATPEGRSQNMAAVIKRPLQVLCREQQDGAWARKDRPRGQMGGSGVLT